MKSLIFPVAINNIGWLCGSTEDAFGIGRRYAADLLFPMRNKNYIRQKLRFLANNTYRIMTMFIRR
jgi:hypothetical protein